MSEDGFGGPQPPADAQTEVETEADASPTDTTPWVEARLAWVAAIVALVVAAPFIAGPHDFMLDDAWIHLSYAKSLRLGDGASYNPGDSELGFSSPLWMALLALWPIAGDPLRPVQLLGLLLHGLTAWIAAHLGLSLARQRATEENPLPLSSITLLSGVLTAVTPTLVQGATSGMEVPLTAALTLGVAWAVVLGRVQAATVLSVLAVWARPEALGFSLMLAAVLVPWRWRAGDRGPLLRAPIAAAIGALGALLVWLLYCQWSLGQWWPNAQYIKGEGGGFAGLGYLAERVLPWQPWLVSLTGALLLLLAVRTDLKARRPELLAVLVAGLGTLIAIAATRPLDDSILFYQSRYFAPFVGVFAVVLPLGLPKRPRWLALVLVLPIAVLSGLMLRTLHERSQEQRADTHQLHHAVAQYIVEHLPADARIAVEGAGAPRFFAPRKTTIIDLVGLNDHEMAHLRDDTKAKMCHLVRRAPTHFAIPAQWVETFTPVFALEVEATFDDPIYTQVDPPRALRVLLLRVEQIHPAWVEGCALQ